MSEKKSDPGAIGILIGGFIVFGILKWFVEDVWPVLRWWLWAGAITAAIWFPYLLGIYLKSARGGYRLALAQKVQSVTAGLLVMFCIWSLGPQQFDTMSDVGGAVKSVVIALAVFGVAGAIESGTVSGVRGVRRWIDAERAKGAKEKEQEKRSDKNAGSENRRQSTTSNDDVAAALDVLGLKEPFSLDELNARRKKLLAQTHPDAGGSANLFRQVQSAYELLKSRL